MNSNSNELSAIESALSAVRAMQEVLMIASSASQLSSETVAGVATATVMLCDHALAVAQNATPAKVLSAGGVQPSLVESI